MGMHPCIVLVAEFREDIADYCKEKYGERYVDIGELTYWFWDKRVYDEQLEPPEGGCLLETLLTNDYGDSVDSVDLQRYIADLEKWANERDLEHRIYLAGVYW